jgi:hypothetical protein
MSYSEAHSYFFLGIQSSDDQTCKMILGNVCACINGYNVKKIVLFNIYDDFKKQYSHIDIVEILAH